MKRRTFEEMVSYFNQTVADMDIDRKYKMELLGMITAIGIACEKELSIEPERKTGKWIDTTQGDHYKCSCCGTRAAFWFNEENSSGWERDMSEWLSDYCPNCGARMEDEE